MSLPTTDPSVDRVVRLAAAVLAAPVAILTIVDGERQRFASAHGLPDALRQAGDMATTYSFCRRVVDGGAPFVVDDALGDAELAAMPVVAQLGLRAYLGVPLAASGAGPRAVLCVADRVPRAWRAHDVDVMRDLAASVVTEIALRDELEARRLSEAHFRALTEHSSDLVSVIDRDGALRYVSPSIERALGFDAASMLGVDAFAYVDDDDRDAMRAVFAALMAEPASSAAVAFRCPHASNGVRMLEGTARNLSHLDGVGGVVVNVADVTGRRSLEAQLRQAQKMEAIGHLAGGIAHDFNNLLTVIRGNLEFIRDALPRDSQAAADVAEADKATTRATGLVRQLLAFGRRQVGHPAVVDLNAVVADARPMLRSALGERMTLDLELSPDLWAVRIDRGQLEQVLMNLVINGGDAMRDVADRRALGIETANVVVSASRASRLGLAGAGDYVRLTVRDAGVGMDAATMARLFEPFFTTKPVGRGTGLGLAVVYGIVTQADGTVQVESEPGAGSRFHVFLPRVDAQVEGVVYATPAMPRGSGTILLVEDEPAVRRTTRRTLERAGYRVVEAQHASDALLVWRELGAESFDAVVTDGRMPGLDGPALVARLRADRSDLPALLVSGYTSGALQDHPGPGLPADVRLLEKPFEAPELLEAVQALFGASSRTAVPA